MLPHLVVECRSWSSADPTWPNCVMMSHEEITKCPGILSTAPKCDSWPVKDTRQAVVVVPNQTLLFFQKHQLYTVEEADPVTN